MATCKFPCAPHSYSQISMYGFHSKADLVKSGSYTGMFLSCCNSQSAQGMSSHVSVLSLRFPTQAIQIHLFCGQGIAQIPLCFMFWFIPQLLCVSCHSGCFWFCCLYSKEACGCVYPKRLCFELRRFTPSVSHHCFWLSPLTGNERFILSGLNYIVPS